MKKTQLFYLLLVLACVLFVTSCSDDEAPSPSPIEQRLQQMTLREKVGQMFYARPETLDTTILPKANLADISMQEVNETMRGVDEKYPWEESFYMLTTSKTKLS